MFGEGEDVIALGMSIGFSLGLLVGVLVGLLIAPKRKGIDK